MSCKYDLFTNPPKKGSKRQPELHARPYDNGSVDQDKLFRMCKQSLLTPDMQRNALSVLTDVMAEQLAEGCNVHIEGIGDFQIALELKSRHVTDPKEVRAGGVMVKTVGFRPDRKLMEYLERNTTFTRASSRRKVTENELFMFLPVLKKFFVDNDGKKSLAAKQMAILMGCSSRQAGAQLKKLETWGYLRNISSNLRSPQYLPEQKLFEE